MCETLGTNWEDTAKQQISLKLEAWEAIERMREIAMWYKAMPNNAQADCKSIAKVIEMALKDLEGEK